MLDDAYSWIHWTLGELDAGKHYGLHDGPHSTFVKYYHAELEVLRLEREAHIHSGYFEDARSVSMWIVRALYWINDIWLDAADMEDAETETQCRDANAELQRLRDLIYRKE